MAKKTSKIAQQYYRKRSSIRKAYKNLLEKGFELPELNLPDIPKKITPASLRRLTTNFSTKKLASKGSYVSRETGEIIKGAKGYSEYRKETYRQAQETRRYKKQFPQFTQPTKENTKQMYEADNYSHFMDRIDSLSSTRLVGRINPTRGGYYTAEIDVSSYKQMLRDIMWEQSTSQGYASYNSYLNQMAESIEEAFEVVSQSSTEEGIYTAYTQLAQLLKGSALSMDEKILANDVTEYESFNGGVE